MVLRVLADDGWVAYRNGTELTRLRTGAPKAPVPFTKLAAANAPEPLVAHEVRVDNSLLRPGENVLALQGLNITLDSSDFTLIPVLKAADRSAPRT